MSDTPARIRAWTTLTHASLVPEIALHLATEVTPLWQATEAALAREGLPPPYWAFAWPGGQALARYLLDHRDVVEGHGVLDFAAGCAIAGIAAAKSGARPVRFAEIDGFARAAIALNLQANGVAGEIVARDLVGEDTHAEIILAGDVCYERPMAERVGAWLFARARAGATVLLADPGRAYLPREGLRELACYDVPTSLDLEDRASRLTRVLTICA